MGTRTVLARDGIYHRSHVVGVCVAGRDKPETVENRRRVLVRLVAGY